MRTKLILILISWSVLGCKQSIEQFSFNIPVVKSTIPATPVGTFNSDSLPANNSIFIGVAPFLDSIVLSTNYADSLQHRMPNNRERNEVWKEAELSTGLQIIPDYSQTINMKLEPYEKQSYPFFPVFVPNTTNDTLELGIKDSYVIAILEAVDSNGEWRPVEERTHDFCGVGHWKQQIAPNQFAMFLMPKYQGDVETMLRIRIKSGDNLMFSKTFQG